MWAALPRLCSCEDHRGNIVPYSICFLEVIGTKIFCWKNSYSHYSHHTSISITTLYNMNKPEKSLTLQTTIELFICNVVRGANHESHWSPTNRRNDVTVKAFVNKAIHRVRLVRRRTRSSWPKSAYFSGRYAVTMLRLRRFPRRCLWQQSSPLPPQRQQERRSLNVFMFNNLILIPHPPFASEKYR